MASPQQINPYDRPDDGSSNKMIAAVLIAVVLHIIVGFFCLVILPNLASILPNREPQMVVVQLIGSLAPPAPAAPDAKVNPDLKGPDVVDLPKDEPDIPQPPIEEQPENIEKPTDVIPLGPKTPEKPPEIKKIKTPPPKPPKVEIEKPKKPPVKPPKKKNPDDEINKRIKELERKRAAKNANDPDSTKVNIDRESGAGDGEGSDLSGGANRGQSIHPEKMKYYTHIRDIVYSNWVLPPETLSSDLAATYQIRIEPNGAVSRVRLVKSSGNADYDLSVERAIRKSSPFPPLPPIFGGVADNPGLQFKTDEFRKTQQY